MPAIKTSKEEILKKSTMIIWKQGFKHTSFKDLSKACDIRAAHFFYYFKDKDDLMCQILETSRQYFKKKIFSIAFNDDLSTEERLTFMMRKLNVLYMQSNNGCLFGNTVLETAHIANSPFNVILRSFFDDFIKSLVHIYSVKSNEQEALARALASVQLMEGAIMMMRLFNDKSYIDNAWKHVMV